MDDKEIRDWWDENIEKAGIWAAGRYGYAVSKMAWKEAIRRCSSYMQHDHYCPKSNYRCNCESCIDRMKQLEIYNICTCGMEDLLKCLKTY